MNKQEAIQRWGSDIVETARDYYETDFGKYLFQEDCPEDDYCAGEEEQIERCTRASRNTKREGPIAQAMGFKELIHLSDEEAYATRRTVSHEYVFQMPVAAYREKRKNLTEGELAFLRGNPGYEYSEHWSTPGDTGERLFAERDVQYLLNSLINNLIINRDVCDDEYARAYQNTINQLLVICS